MGKTLLLLGLGLSLCLTTLSVTAAGVLKPAVDFPLSVDSYHDQQIPSLFGKLTGRIQREPLNLIATIIFFAAIMSLCELFGIEFCAIIGTANVSINAKPGSKFGSKETRRAAR